VQRRLDREEAERQRRIEEHRRYEEGQRRKLEANRLRRFTELAAQWRSRKVARDFLDALKASPATSSDLIEGRSREEWIAWAEEQLNATDPIARGVEGVFRDVGAVQAWTYRD
jgi:hypothetical protein